VNGSVYGRVEGMADGAGEEPVAGTGDLAPGGVRTAVPTVPVGRVESGTRGIPTGLPRQLISFVTIGVASTLAYGLLFLGLRTGFGAQSANLIALLITAIGNTAANRRLTFGVSGRAGVARHQVQGLLVFAFGLGLTSGSLALLDAVAPGASRPVELGVLVVANLAATVLRFLLMRVWIFRQHRWHSR
jgi:putative flippase GtrA